MAACSIDVAANVLFAALSVGIVNEGCVVVCSDQSNGRHGNIRICDGQIFGH